ncbi:hypothetical protein H9Q70_005305 [Fusarium xylarioides]|nr:hypothetical protein H9Q70_005305 [Fusarium xylarioides]KAG5782758.1 hypothetical protein H9Q73_003558 [Fusarium xylarioides]
MSTWLQTDFGPRVLEDSAIEKCANPSALQVCQESRQLTLSKFALMRHGILKDRAFYFRPECDVIWLNTDVTDDIYYQEKLQKYYGQDLGRIESLLVEETEWEGSNMYPGCLGVFGGLRFVDILLDDQPPELMVTDDDTDQDVHVGNDSDDGQPSWTIRYLIRPELGFQGINSVGEPTEASNARE